MRDSSWWQASCLRALGILGLVVAAFAGSVLVLSSASAATVTRGIPLTPVIRKDVCLGTGWHTFHTVGTTGGDPVMHVYDGSGELARGDDEEGLNPRVDLYFWTYQCVGILVYAYNGNSGQTRLQVDTGTPDALAPFAGTRIDVSAGSYTYETAVEPDDFDQPDPHKFLPHDVDAYIYGFQWSIPNGRLVAWNDDSGVGLNSRIVGDGLGVYSILRSAE